LENAGIEASRVGTRNTGEVREQNWKNGKKIVGLDSLSEPDVC